MVRSPGGSEEWEWVLEPVCGGVGEGVLQPPRPRLARGRRRGRGQRPLPLPAVGVQLLLLVSHDLDSHHSYSYILIKVFVSWAQHTLAFCEKASRSSVCRFFHASPSSTLIALSHGECWMLDVKDTWNRNWIIIYSRSCGWHYLAAPARHCAQVLVVSALVCMGGGSKGESSNLSAPPQPKNIW